ncbi:hypothetical protein Vafri_18532, partial [Volvox africanus]
MRACWARPLLGGSSIADGVDATAPVAGAAAATAAEISSGKDAAVLPIGSGGDGATSGEREGGCSSGGGNRLQWIVASVGILASDEGDYQDPASGPALLDEAVCVWAVDGLSAVVLSGLPRGSVSSTKTAASPKAVLWGLEHRSVAWLQPGKLLPSVATALRPGDYAICAYVTYPGGMPLLQTADSCIGMQGAYAEVRSYEIAPTATTTPGGAGHTATFLRVTGVARQAMTGSPETISTMLVHPAADVALIRDRTGGVALWSLRPLCELPLCVAPGAVSARRVLLASPGQLAAVAWLSCCSRTPSRPQEIDGGGGGGGDGDYMLAYAACIHGGRLLIYAVSLPCTAAVAEGVVPNAATWGATFLAEVLRVELPSGVGAVRALYEVSYDATAAVPYATSTLVALGSRVDVRAPVAMRPGGGSGSGGGAAARRGSSGGGAMEIATATASSYDHDPGSKHTHGHSPQQDVWLTWRLAIKSPCPTTGVRSVELVLQHVDDLTGALTPTHGSVDAAVMDSTAGPLASERIAGFQWPGTPRTSAIVSCCCTSLPTPIDADIIASSSSSSDACSGAGDDSDRNSNSSNSTRGRSRVPCLMSGTSDGRVQFWRPATAAAEVLPDGSSSGGNAAGMELVQSLPCGFRRRSSSGGGEETIDGGGQGGGDEDATAGMVVAVALDDISGYAAAATTCGDGEEEEALYIWRLREGAVESDADGSAAAAATFGRYDLEDIVPVHDTVSALSWLAAAGLSACLAVGYASGRVALLVRDRGGGWEQVASYWGAAAVAAFGSPRGGAIAMAAGNHLLCLSNALDCRDGEQHPERTIADVAADAAGPLPPYHPGVVHALVAKGKLATACHVLRRLLTWLRNSADHRSSDEGAAGGGTCGGLNGSANRIARRPVGRLPLVIGLSELLGDGLVTSRGLGAFQQALTAPVLAAAATNSGATTDAAGVLNAAAAASPYSAGGGGGDGRVDDPSAPLRPLIPANRIGSESVAMSASMGRLASHTNGTFGSTIASTTVPIVAAAPMLQPQPVVSSVSGSSLNTGVLDMSAFGDFGSASAGAAAAGSPLPPPSESSGYSAFGVRGTAGVATAPPRPESPPRRLALETGTLDMSAFSSYGAFTATGARSNPPPPPPASAFNTGLLDMSAFGDFIPMSTGTEAGTAAELPPPPPSSPPHPPAPQTTFQTGQPDMSSFNGFKLSSATMVSPLPPPQHPQEQLHPAPSPSALHTGMLDLSAFGDFSVGRTGACAPDTVPPLPPRASLWTSPPSTAQSKPSSAFPQAEAARKVEALDMPTASAAGDGTVPDPTRSIPISIVSVQRLSPTPPMTSLPQTGLHTGMLDMSAFSDFAGGGFGGSGSTVPPPPPPPPMPPPPPPPSPLPQQTSDPMLSGMIDMSAFGDFGGFAVRQETEDENATDHGVSGGDVPSSTTQSSSADPSTSNLGSTLGVRLPAMEPQVGGIPDAVHTTAAGTASVRTHATVFAYPPPPLRSVLQTGAISDPLSSMSEGTAAATAVALMPMVSTATSQTFAAAAAAAAAAEPSTAPSNRTASSSLLFTPAATPLITPMVSHNHLVPSGGG